MSKASVLMVLSHYRHAGGVESVIDNLCSGLSGIGYKMAIGAFSFDQNPPSNVQKVHLKKFRSLTSNTDGYDFDIIHSHQPRMNYYSLLTRKPLVFHWHGVLNRRIHKFNLKFSTYICRNRISRVISISHSAVNDFGNAGKVSSKIVSDVIYNGVDTKHYNLNLPMPYTKGDPQLLFVGNLYYHKNVGAIINAMPQIMESYPKAHLQIVGYGEDYDKLSSMIKRMKIESNVELVGRIPLEDLRLRYSSCDIYVSASKWEMFGLPALEAMACGKPVLLSDIPSHKELVEGSNAGLIFSFVDSSSIFNKVKEIYANRRSFRSAARQFAEKYDWSLICSKVAKVYDDLLVVSNKNYH